MRQNYILTLFFSLISGVVFSQVVSIGTGSERTTGLPVDPFFKYSYSQSIYLSSEINQTGAITKINYKVAAGRELNSSNSWVVYMAHTSKTEFSSTSDWVASSDLTQVYSGTFTHTPGADVELVLNIPFNYNGTDNLLIAIEENQDSYDSGDDDLLATAVSENRSIMYRNDNNNPSPNSPPTATNIQSFIANVDLNFGVISGGGGSICDTAIQTIDDDFESYAGGTGNPMPDCWTKAGSFSVGGVRNSSGEAYSGSNYVFGYTLFNAGGYAYFMSPKLSTINSNYVADFNIKGGGQTGTAVSFEYGTMPNNTDLNTFTPFGTVQTTTSDYVNHITPKAPNNSHEYFVLRFQITEQHTSVYLDDFKWITAISLDVESVEKEKINFSVYPNPAKSSYVTIDLEGTFRDNIELVVYNALGEIVLTKREMFNVNNNMLDISKLSSGIYFLELRSNAKRCSKKLIIK